jgi:hypothetical protein
MEKPNQQDKTKQDVEPIYALSQALRSSPELATRVRSATHPGEIVAIAKSINIDLSMALLRRFSKQLSAPYWPWDNQNDEVRRKFFEAMNDGDRET